MVFRRLYCGRQRLDDDAVSEPVDAFEDRGRNLGEAFGVSWLLRQEIVSYAEHVDQQQVEVGEHRGPSFGVGGGIEHRRLRPAVYVSFTIPTQPRSV
jgi:hypothetical protein